MNKKASEFSASEPTSAPAPANEPTADRSRTAWIVAVGDELITGQRLDTNSQWLSRQLADLGFQVLRHVTVGDDEQEIARVVRQAAETVAVVVCTGGLGPTQDDLTRQAIATACGVPLELQYDALKAIEQLFARRGRPMPERNRLQAMFPLGSRVIDNPHGSAPGIDLAYTGKRGVARIIALPGVPAEMQEMWATSVAPRLLEYTGRGHLRQYFRVINVFGVGESECEARMPELFVRGRRPTVGITVSRATISLRISDWATDPAAFEQAIAPTLATIQQRLGDMIFGQGDEELEDCVIQQVISAGRRLAVLELGATAWLGPWLLRAAAEPANGPSDAVGGGVVGAWAFPDLVAAERWLHATDTPLPTRSTENEESLAALARHVAKHAGADLLVMVHQYPTWEQMVHASGPFPVDLVVVDHDQVVQNRQLLGGHPDVLGPRIAKSGLDLLRRLLSQQGRG
ncbi:MAG: damage-inducible protein CinA [Pirellulaceae bacterium]|nr:MAG: damage-inducible protein CinA [Pirellulaceae bacterium]